MINAETKLTEAVRRDLEASGAHCVKLSDRFTRGVPDMLVVTDRIVMIEFKIYGSELNVEKYANLGLSGSQDHHIRNMVRRSARSACVITGLPDGSKRSIWIPISPDTETINLYRRAASGADCLKWVLGSWNKST